MAENLELSINPLQLEGLQLGNTRIDDFINELFKDNNRHKKMCLALQEYHRNDGGSPEVDAFEVQNVTYNAEALSGRFRCKFRVNYHYTCSDVHNNAMDTIDWDFRIDKDYYRLLLTGEETLERDFNEF
jgi:hypothetical protein